MSKKSTWPKGIWMSSRICSGVLPFSDMVVRIHCKDFQINELRKHARVNGLFINYLLFGTFCWFGGIRVSSFFLWCGIRNREIIEHVKTQMNQISIYEEIKNSLWYSISCCLFENSIAMKSVTLVEIHTSYVKRQVGQKIVHIHGRIPLCNTQASV